MTPTDAQLLSRWRNGDRAAGELLFDRYYQAVERFFANKVSDTIDDLVQDTFMACVEGRYRVSEETRFRSYLFAVAYNVLCAHLRRRYRQGSADIDIDQLTLGELIPGQNTLMTERREQRLLLEALRSIPLSYQVLLELHYWEEMTTSDMAAILNTPVGTVRSRLVKARELLEAALGQLSQSAAELSSTITRLEDWAKACRHELAAAARAS